MKRPLTTTLLFTGIIASAIWLTSSPAPVHAATVDDHYELAICIDKGTSDLLGKDGYTIGISDAVNFAIYKKSVRASNNYDPSIWGIARTPSSDTASCQSYRTGINDVKVDFANDRPVILVVEVPVKKPDGTWEIVRATKTYPMFIDSSFGMFEINIDVSQSKLQKITTSSITKVPDGFRLFTDLSCPTETTLTCWIKRVWSFSQTAILVLSVAAMVFAGVTYMTSRGNPKQVELAKKIIIGALSAVAVIILGRLFLTKIIGVPWL